MCPVGLSLEDFAEYVARAHNRDCFTRSGWQGTAFMLYREGYWESMVLLVHAFDPHTREC